MPKKTANLDSVNIAISAMKNRTGESKNVEDDPFDSLRTALSPNLPEPIQPTNLTLASSICTKTLFSNAPTTQNHIQHLHRSNNDINNAPVTIKSSTVNHFEYINNAYVSSTSLPDDMTKHTSHNSNTRQIQPAQHFDYLFSSNEIVMPVASSKNKCICRNKEEHHFKCLACTRDYPISVRRSKDGEEAQAKRRNDRKEFEKKIRIDNKNENYENRSLIPNTTTSDRNASPLSESSTSAESSSSSSYNSNSSSSTSHVNYESKILNLKPSPIPISSALIALLALTKPTNKFRPPPNVNLAHVIQNELDMKK